MKPKRTQEGEKIIREHLEDIKQDIKAYNYEKQPWSILKHAKDPDLEGYITFEIKKLGMYKKVPNPKTKKGWKWEGVYSVTWVQ